MTGQIIKIISNDYFIRSNTDEYICNAPGKFRNKNIIPVVGDYVTFNKKALMLLEVLPRKNVLVRPNVANIDQAFIITSLKQPDFSSFLLDEFLVLLSYHDIYPIICLTKSDLLDKREIKKYKDILKYYKKIGYQVIYNNQLFKIKRLLKNKTTVFTGQTGVGKSSLLNKLDKDLHFATNEISKALGRGKHTTRYISLVELYHGKVLDTPGFSSLEIGDMSKEKIKKAFIEFDKYKCMYDDCNHINENNCAIKEEVGKNILQSRYDNYLKMMKKVKE